MGTPETTDQGASETSRGGIGPEDKLRAGIPLTPAERGQDSLKLEGYGIAALYLAQYGGRQIMGAMPGSPVVSDGNYANMADTLDRLAQGSGEQVPPTPAQ